MSVLGDIRGAAVEIGRKHRLENYDGSWRCWGCGVEYPFDPSLHCQRCRNAAVVRRNRHLEAERRMGDESKRWRALVRAMATDSRIDLEDADRLLSRARQLPSVTGDRIAALEAAKDRRWPRRPAPPADANRTYVVEYDDPAEDWPRG